MADSGLKGPKYERYLQKQHDLECVILKYLLDHPDEPLTLDRLTARYRSDCFLNVIVLNQLRTWNYITIDSQQHVTINRRGVDRLIRLHRERERERADSQIKCNLLERPLCSSLRMSTVSERHANTC